MVIFILCFTTGGIIKVIPPMFIWHFLRMEGRLLSIVRSVNFHLYLSRISFGDYTNLTVHNGIVRPIWTRLHNGELSVWTHLMREADFLNLRQLLTKVQKRMLVLKITQTHLLI